MSLKLSQILDEVGLSKKVIHLRRVANFRMEKMMHINYKLLGMDIDSFTFGSQTEASTTLGLESDTDNMSVDKEVNVVQSFKEWKKGKTNLLVVQGGCIPAGYCCLQLLKKDKPQPEKTLHGKHEAFFEDNQGRLIMKNNMHFKYDLPEKTTVHGPARTVNKDNREMDIISAFRCKSMSKQVLPAMKRFANKDWPTAEMLQVARESGFFVVPVGHRSSETRDIEWRVSPSLTERSLMLGLNITQLKCYVVLKMIKKDLIKPKVGDSVTSFHLKTILFHMVEHTPKETWREDNLLYCIDLCLQRLLSCLENRSCPNFLIPEENLFSGRIEERQYPHLKVFVKHLLDSNGHYTLDIKRDNVGQQLYAALSGRVGDSEKILLSDIVMGQCTFNMCQGLDRSTIQLCLCFLLEGQFFIKDTNQSSYISRVRSKLTQLHNLQKSPDQDIMEAATDWLPYVYSSYGSLLAAQCLFQGKSISSEAICYLKEGLNSDFMAGRLKFASVLYCSGQFTEAVDVLEGIQQNYDVKMVIPVCGCNSSHLFRTKPEFCRRVSQCDDISQWRQFVARQVMFLPHELPCCPPQLVFEMFRGVGPDREARAWDMYWMDLAVVDAPMFLYFLLYLTYGKLGKRDRQYSTLKTLIMSIRDERPYQNHTETAYNILGQCLEMEGDFVAAMVCYRRSLEIRPRNNAANILVALNMYKLVKSERVFRESHQI